MKKYLLPIFVLICMSVGVRLYNILAPITDRHSFRQTDTYAIAQRMYRGEGSLLFPRFYHSHNPVNIERYFLAELPIYEGLIASVWALTGEQLIWARMVSIFFITTATVSLFIIARRWWNEGVAWVSSIFLTLFPSSYFWGRAISPDVMALTAFVTAVALAPKKLMGNVPRFFGASLLFTVSVLIKPQYLVFSIFFAVYFYIQNSKKVDVLRVLRGTKGWQEYIRSMLSFLFVPGVLFMLWRAWLLTFDPSTRSDPSITGLMHGYMGYLNFWAESNWPRVLITDRLLGETLTPLGGGVALFGAPLVWLQSRKNGILTATWLGCCALISLVISWGSYVHDYYLLPWLPIMSLLAGFSLVFLGVQFKKLLRTVGGSQRAFLTLGGVLTLFIMGLFAIQQWKSSVTGFFAPDEYDLTSEQFAREYKQIESIISEGDKVVTVLAEYTPYVLNAIEREGNIYPVPLDVPCPDPTTFFQGLTELYEIEPKEYVILQAKDAYVGLCSRSTLQEYLSSRYLAVMHGEELVVYKVVQSSVEVWGDTQNLVLITQSLGPDVRIEVGGLPGANHSTLITPKWEQLPDGRLQAEFFNTGDWQSFKFYWESPAVTLHNPAWRQNFDGWFVRRVN